MIKRMNLAIGAAAMALVMAGCSSVPLDQPPVEDKKIGTLPQQPGGGGTQSKVEPVVTDNAGLTNLGPQNVARVILFDYDSYVIKPEYQSIVDGHARWMKANPSRKLNIEGHTDERGGREYNLALGQRRAEAVRRALTLLGVPDAQMEAVSFGKEKPAAMGSDESAWAQNRRAEFTYR
ncbi:peptidoglycan-associated lipoprotein Pal [Caenimonas aquaedulcis]|uniref:Peptidoglycan-associated lipoprotein n=1 Tax=Caenimonas aquaedulcis TaxID=2793270 RepID=A0A931MEU5_9BURK|nr:peptidoglycan-associated lipoprotein Pal [Caenimonas aquaedulcis]MBG9386868.1 peptidoglycan-associated lipoprotein Pal [Caenimonas aquaedulcis]